jgi:hypothetical protein
MRRRHLTLLIAAIAFAMNGYAAESWNVIHCSPVDTAEASGIRIINEHGMELFRVCQDGSPLPQTGFTNVTSYQDSDFIFVTQVGAKACEATLYRKSGAHYIRIGWWSGWDIRIEKWHNRPAIHYEELEPTADHPKSVVYFTWNGNRLVPNRSTPMLSFHQ